tara:strand:- start:233 stop:676 length:444 start_codon:yes stop_codon:yes gene_type:complete
MPVEKNPAKASHHRRVALGKPWLPPSRPLANKPRHWLPLASKVVRVNSRENPLRAKGSNPVKANPNRDKESRARVREKLKVNPARDNRNRDKENRARVREKVRVSPAKDNLRKASLGKDKDKESLLSPANLLHPGKDPHPLPPAKPH